MIIYSIDFPTIETVLRYNFFIFITSRILRERPLFTVARTVGLADDASIIRKRKSSSQTERKKRKRRKDSNETVKAQLWLRVEMDLGRPV
ncbi:hypothetical protein CDAR_515701 [Caerostris darwini]|uniref:Uncharacterized protein n=1 Tax=Caerostris darwini TaxID=1538125 RepID=A0AAV4S763_9ARAC|nr:hypothetical protein CDAR_515701 [Caerostris darwini]